MLKLEIKFNDAQMRAEHKYAPEAIYAALDKSFTKYGFRRETLSDGTICYYGNGMPRDYGTFGRPISEGQRMVYGLPCQMALVQ